MKIHNAFFVTATDTDVGKTVVSAALIAGLKEIFPNKTIAYWKPVQTGTTLDRHFIANSCDAAKILPSAYEFTNPLSPDQAARAQSSMAPTVERLIQQLEEFSGTFDYLVVEGAGGISVPLNDANETWLDFLDRANLRTLVVTRSSLGTLNHTSLTLDKLKTAGQFPLATIVNGLENPENLASLQRMHPKQPFLRLPFLEGASKNVDWSRETKNLASSVLEISQAVDQPLSSAAKNRLWHPYTQHKTSGTPVVVESAKGIWLHTQEGHKLVDCVGSWWVNTIGHGNQNIGEAIAAQQAKLDHTIFAGAVHEPAATLATRILEQVPPYLSKMFFTDNGSCAVEVALKIAIQSWTNQGIMHRNKIMSFYGAYHGDTFGAMSVGAVQDFHKPFSSFLFPGIKLSPATIHKTEYCPEGADSLQSYKAKLDEAFAQCAHDLAAVIIEPIIQGASGMNVQQVEWLNHLGDLCKHYEIPLIYDEVFSGMGRTGEFLAAQLTTTKPDLVCLAKGVTGGNLPMALTLASDRLFEMFLSDDRSKALLHGHSFTANPIACAAANATLDVYKEQNLIANVRKIEKRFSEWLETNAHDISNPRCVGAVMAFELPQTGESHYFNNDGFKFSRIAYNHNLFIRPLGNTIYMTPPFSMTESELDFVLENLRETLNGFIRSRYN
ncbi:MAG: adenosylmethionine--8-amino-7-oxononanoate transaminase [Oligoflexales bacterium]